MLAGAVLCEMELGERGGTREDWYKVWGSRVSGEELDHVQHLRRGEESETEDGPGCAGGAASGRLGVGCL